MRRADAASPGTSAGAARVQDEGRPGGEDTDNGRKAGRALGVSAGAGLGGQRALTTRRGGADRGPPSSKVQFRASQNSSARLRTVQDGRAWF